MKQDEWIMSLGDKVGSERSKLRTRTQGCSTFRDCLLLPFLYPQEPERIGTEVGEHGIREAKEEGKFKWY